MNEVELVLLMGSLWWTRRRDSGGKQSSLWHSLEVVVRDRARLEVALGASLPAKPIAVRGRRSGDPNSFFWCRSILERRPAPGRSERMITLRQGGSRVFQPSRVAESSACKSGKSVVSDSIASFQVTINQGLQLEAAKMRLRRGDSCCFKPAPALGSSEKSLRFYDLGYRVLHP